jgi:hypothetical protein
MSCSVQQPWLRAHSTTFQKAIPSYRVHPVFGYVSGTRFASS